MNVVEVGCELILNRRVSLVFKDTQLFSWYLCDITATMWHVFVPLCGGLVCQRCACYSSCLPVTSDCCVTIFHLMSSGDVCNKYVDV